MTLAAYMNCFLFVLEQMLQDSFAASSKKNQRIARVPPRDKPVNSWAAVQWQILRSRRRIAQGPSRAVVDVRKRSDEQMLV